MNRSVLTIARRDLRALFDHPTAYILLVVFLAVTEVLYFNLGQVFQLGVATLRPMLGFLPWIFLFFVPAVAMRAIAEEVRGGTIEIVLTQPLTDLDFLLGKFVGHLAFVWIALALTILVPLGLSLGADMHLGVIVAQYAGAALLALGLTAVGIWASSVTPNQITAFIVGIATMFALIMAGADLLVTGLPVGLANVAARLSVLPHFENIARGVIDLRDAVYFVTLAGVFLSLAYLAIAGRRLARFGGALRRLRAGTALIVATLIVVNLFGRHIGGRLDLTPGKAYTLSRASRAVLGNLDDLVTLTLYISKELPPQVSLLQRDIEDLLADVDAAGRGMVRVRHVDPAGDEDAESEARAAGIGPVQFNVVGRGELQVKEGYLGLTVRYADGQEVIPFIQRTEDLEYQLVSFIRGLTRGARDAVGLITAPGMTGAPAGSFQQLREALSGQYEVRSLTLPTDSSVIPDDIRVLVLAGSPPFLSDSQAQAFEAFFQRGGGALVMASGMAPQQQGLMGGPQPVGYNRLLRHFGVSIRSDLVYDLVSNEQVVLGVTGGRIFISYPFWVRGLSTRALTLNRDVESVLLPWTSTIDVADSVAPITTTLYVTSEGAGTESGSVLLHPQRDYARDDLGERILAVAVNPLASDSGARVSGRIVVVGNGEFAGDRHVANSPETLVFALNAVDWLAQDDALMTIRSKNRRPPALQFESAVLRDAVKWGNLIGVPLLLVGFGAYRLVRRRRKTRRTYAAAPPPV